MKPARELPTLRVVGMMDEDREFASPADYGRSDAWDYTRAVYRFSDRPQDCFVCGRANGIELHHIRYDRLGELNELNDLVPLCGDHHYEVEKHIGKRLVGVTRANAHLHYKRTWDARRSQLLRRLRLERHVAPRVDDLAA